MNQERDHGDEIVGTELEDKGGQENLEINKMQQMGGEYRMADDSLGRAGGW